MVQGFLFRSFAVLVAVAISFSGWGFTLANSAWADSWVGNYCGSTYEDALDGHAACPNGDPYECPAGEMCYAGIVINDSSDEFRVRRLGDSSVGNYCGSTYEDALDGHAACPNGDPYECPAGEMCYAGIVIND